MRSKLKDLVNYILERPRAVATAVFGSIASLYLAHDIQHSVAAPVAPSPNDISQRVHWQNPDVESSAALTWLASDTQTFTGPVDDPLDSVATAPEAIPAGASEEVTAVDPATKAAFDREGATEQTRNSIYFPETKHNVSGLFADYWLKSGGLAQQGYPRTEMFVEVSPTDGKPYAVQYFERAVFEYHPEKSDPQYKVLLSLLGVEALKRDYPDGTDRIPALDQATKTAFDQQGATGETQRGICFPETQQTISGLFADYWKRNGGLAQQGYPISKMHVKVSPTDGKPYIVQYFERAVFEYHPEEKDPQYKVLLSLLGNERFGNNYIFGEDAKLYHKLGEPGGGTGGETDLLTKDRFNDGPTDPKDHSWLFSSSNRAVVKLYATDKDKVTQAFHKLPAGRYMQLYIAGDQQDAQAIAKYYKLDSGYFEDLTIQDRNGKIFNIGKTWYEIKKPENNIWHFTPAIVYLYPNMVGSVDKNIIKENLLSIGFSTAATSYAESGVIFKAIDHDLVSNTALDVK